MAVVGPDEVAAMALPTLPDWRWARDVHARTVRAWLDTGLTTVIAEGPGTPDEVDRLTGVLPADVLDTAAESVAQTAARIAGHLRR